MVDFDCLLSNFPTFDVEKQNYTSVYTYKYLLCTCQKIRSMVQLFIYVTNLFYNKTVTVGNGILTRIFS